VVGAGGSGRGLRCGCMCCLGWGGDNKVGRMDLRGEEGALQHSAL
jgi:hypothetical protein